MRGFRAFSPARLGSERLPQTIHKRTALTLSFSNTHMTLPSRWQATQPGPITSTPGMSATRPGCTWSYPARSRAHPARSRAHPALSQVNPALSWQPTGSQWRTNPPTLGVQLPPTCPDPTLNRRSTRYYLPPTGGYLADLVARCALPATCLWQPHPQRATGST